MPRFIQDQERKGARAHLTTVKLREKFIQLKSYLIIKQRAKPERKKIGELGKAVQKLQEDINTYKTVAETVTEEDKTLKQKIQDLENQVSALTASIAPFRKLPPDLLKRFIVPEGITDE